MRDYRQLEQDIFFFRRLVPVTTSYVIHEYAIPENLVWIEVKSISLHHVTLTDTMSGDIGYKYGSEATGLLSFSTIAGRAVATRDCSIFVPSDYLMYLRILHSSGNYNARLTITGIKYYRPKGDAERLVI